MEKIEISKQILDQMDRQINFAYFLASAMFVLAGLVLGVQYVINEKKLEKMKKEIVQQIADVTLPLFINNIKQIMITGFEIEDVKNFLVVYKKNFSGYSDAKNQMNELIDKGIVNRISYSDNSLPIEKQSRSPYEGDLNKDALARLDSDKKIIDEYETLDSSDKQSKYQRIEKARLDIIELIKLRKEL